MNSIKQWYHENGTLYTVKTGTNGMKYVDKKTVRKDVLHLSAGNSKTGKAITFNFPIEYTCNHNCECYREKKCYACNGRYKMDTLQILYSENLSFFLSNSSETFVNTVCDFIGKHPSFKLFRWFSVGDFFNVRFLECVLEIARRNPDVKFWTYTKKYDLINNYFTAHGIENKPENLCIIFSHWLNGDGSYFPMNNPFNFPLSEFVPTGKESMIDLTRGHVCPCSDPNSIETCETCKTPCYDLKAGGVMYLKEHSTPATKLIDKVIRAGKNKVKKLLKGGKAA